MNLTTTLQEVKEFLKRGSNKGCKCPACDQYVKVYKRPLNSGMARILIEMYKLGDSEYHHIKDHLRKEGLKNGHDWTLLRFWGMIDPMIKEEEDSFLRTLAKGIQRFENYLASANDKTIDGKFAFELYDTFGFPVDLTEDIAKDSNLSVDVDGFNKNMDII